MALFTSQPRQVRLPLLSHLVNQDPSVLWLMHSSVTRLSLKDGPVSGDGGSLRGLRLSPALASPAPASQVQP